MKYYLLYLKYNKQLYAYTTVESYLDKFLEQRNPECFNIRTIKLKGEQERIFIYTHKLKQLNNYPYQTGTGPSEYIDLMATAEEDNLIDVHVNRIEEWVENINKVTRKYPIKKKYKESLDNLTHIHDTSGNILLDIFSLFIDIHKDTFIETPILKN